MFVIFFTIKVLYQDPAAAAAAAATIAAAAAAAAEKRRKKRIKNARWRRNVLLRKHIAAGKSGAGKSGSMPQEDTPQEATRSDPAVQAEKRRKKRARTARWRKRA